MTIPDNIQQVFLILGGLGLFLYGMKMMMLGLEELAGSKMRTAVERATSNRFLGIGVGALVTVLIQSSTATSVMAVGLINAGLMTLSQAITLIMGAHIGTTLTAHIFALRIDTIAPLFIFFGIGIYLFVGKKLVKDIGYILLGVGILFFGLTVMGGPLRAFAQTEGFQSVLTAFSNPLLAMLAGFIFTAVIQSSTAATGILVAIMGSGEIDFRVAAFLVLGISAGTTLTALLASFAGQRESKRAALANVVFVTVGCIVFGLLIGLVPGILTFFASTWEDGGTQVAMFYTFFKVGLTILFLPFIKYLAQLMYAIIPKRTQWVDPTNHLQYIKSSSAHLPAVAIEEAHQELKRMGTMVLIDMQLALEVFSTGDAEKALGVFEGESSVSYLNKQITTMLTGLENVKHAADVKRLSTLLYVAAKLQRISSDTKNIAAYDIRTKKKKKLRLGPAAMEELDTIGQEVIKILTLALEFFDHITEENITQLQELTLQASKLFKTYTKNHIKRLKTEETDPKGGIIFVNMLGALELCSNDANTIVDYFTDSDDGGV